MASVSISCPSCSATDGVVRNGKSTAGHQRYLCSHCRKTWQLQFTYTASQPGTHQKIIDIVSASDIRVRSTQHVVSLRFSHQKGHQHAEQRGLLHDKANAPAGRVHRRYCDSDWLL
nr:IS1 family transposase [Shigella sonnei]